MNIVAQTIPHEKQRYPTVGDYQQFGRITAFTISQMNNKDYEFLVFIHELIEHHLCVKHGVKLEDIDRYDMEYEKNRTPTSLDEPGLNEDAPYHDEHMFATYIEALVAQKLEVDWNEYDEAVNSL